MNGILKKMNDFTKEELKFILIALEQFSIKDLELNNKTQFLIDNYCDHIWIFHLKLPGSSIECRKCQKVLQNINH